MIMTNAPKAGDARGIMTNALEAGDGAGARPKGVSVGVQLSLHLVHKAKTILSWGGKRNKKKTCFRYFTGF